MFEKEFYIAQLLQKRLQNHLTEDEQAAFDEWLAERPENFSLLSDLSNNEKLVSELNTYQSPDGKDIFNRVKAGLKSGMTTRPEKKIRLWQSISVAAAVVGVFFMISFFYTKFNNNTFTFNINRDIKPGRSGASLTLANGQVIRLSNKYSDSVFSGDEGDRLQINNGKLIYLADHDNDISETATGKQNVLNTSNGQTFGVVLPDGTKVWLNSGSRLQYPACFKGSKERLVSLVGEAYFEVAKDKAHPFVLRSKGQDIVVLGTRFNVNAYVNEDRSVTSLFEGSVRLKTTLTEKILTPGEEALNHDDALSIRKANIESVLDWRSDEFYFDNVSFKAALRKVERWYDIEFVYNEEISDDMMAGGWISKNNKLSAVLALIERSGQVSFRIEGKRIFVKKL
ncbi:MAG: DUF4974 domain-containing protein [Pedobacter sp.]|nr:MAG: DUF4974 domain-containing protein [Pedobacter sp.]